MPEPSGVQWVARFPGSKSADDLLPDFRDRVKAFISAVQRAGGAVSIASTFRPPERAYLMHWSCLIANSGQDPSGAAPLAGVDIDWAHGGDVGSARNAARKMVAGYGIKFPAALVSRHTQRRAIDMNIDWNGTLSVIDFNGQTHTIASAPSNHLNPALHAVGKTFGVVKLVSDPPHWSDDGH